MTYSLTLAMKIDDESAPPDDWDWQGFVAVDGHVSVERVGVPAMPERRLCRRRVCAAPIIVEEPQELGSLSLCSEPSGGLR